MADGEQNNQPEPAFETEEIPGEAIVTRLIDQPRMFTPGQGLIWDNTFEFPGGAGESVNWDKYAPPPDEVHRLGHAREASKTLVRADYKYAGYLPARTGDVRNIKTNRGHCFQVEHVPSEGIHHAEIRRVPNPTQSLSRGDKAELRLALQKVFGDLVPCPDAN